MASQSADRYAMPLPRQMQDFLRLFGQGLFLAKKKKTFLKFLVSVSWHLVLIGVKILETI